jgi:hypothetical protein
MSVRGSSVELVATIFGEFRAALGLVGTIFGLRRRRILLLERRQQLNAVLREALSNLDGIRRVWSEEHHRFNWRAWLHSDLLRTRAWREHKAALTTRLDGGPVLTDQLALDLDALYAEFDDAARGSHAFSSDWESRLVDLASTLRAELMAYPHRVLDRLAAARTGAVVVPEVDPRIRTPASPEEMQRRALERLPTVAEDPGEVAKGNDLNDDVPAESA